MPKSVLLVEDDRPISRFVELELRHEGYIVDVAHDGISGYEKIRNNEYDIIILDIMLPGMDGIELLKKVRLNSDVPVILLTAKSDVNDKVLGLDIGADDYITKPFAIEELLARMRVLLRGKEKIYRCGEELKAADLVLNMSTRTVKRGGINISLTKTEFDLLQYMLKNKNVVLSRNRILSEVWGYDFLGDTNIVDVYIRYLRSKIDDGYENKLIHTVRGVGYVLKENAK
ncbi:response regulator transcription factor [Caldanaerobius polysaccharolyticus]|uniref:response regulator transcription factor n=1 Tax=Caldanaerobius polysaccharolyticus TaxID=44256 RepID=UPI00047CAA78|nr:response regulator transcription factor [Caldanaerobius polysaccharolyticus]